MGNLLITIIGILFTALLLTAGISYIKPTAYIEHNQANTNTAQIEALVADYNNLQMIIGHRPGYSDYASVYGTASANSKYSASSSAVTVPSKIDGLQTSGQSGTYPANNWSYLPGCGTTGGPQDCFCMPVTSPTDVTYKATQVSGIQQMDNGTQSRLEFSTAGCTDTSPISTPQNWPTVTPSTYYLIVPLNAAPSSNGGTPNYTYLAAGQYGPCSTTCGTGVQNLISYTCTREPDGSPALNSYCTAPPATQACTSYSACPTNGTCGSGSANACSSGTVIPSSESTSGQTSYWTCAGTNNGSNSSQCSYTSGGSPPNSGVCGTTAGACTTGTASTVSDSGGVTSWTCTASGGTATCTGNDGVCSTTAAGVCTTGTASSTSDQNNTTSWTCASTNGGSTTNCSGADGVCSTTAGTCSVGTAAGTTDNGTTTTWTCESTTGGSSHNCSVNDPAGVTYTTSCPIYGACSTTCGTGGTQTISSWTCTGTDGSVTTGTPGNSVCAPPASTQSCASSSNCIVTGAYSPGEVDGGCTTSTYLCNVTGYTCTDAAGNPAPSPAWCGNVAPAQCTGDVEPASGGNGNPSSCSTLVPAGYFVTSVQYGACSNSCGVGTQTPTSWTCANSVGTSEPMSSCSPNTKACADYSGCGGSCPATNSPVNGSCGTTAGVCTSGSASATSDNGTTTSWSCTGSNGGGTANCSMNDSAGASCTDCSGTSHASGSTWQTSTTSDGRIEYCYNQNTNTAGSATRATTTITTNYSCSSGTIAVVSQTTQQCDPIQYCGDAPSCTTSTTNGGSAPACSQVNGSCGTTTGSCTAGTASATSDNGTTTSWTCAGSNGGSTSSCNTPDQPVCGGQGTCGCTVGTLGGSGYSTSAGCNNNGTCTYSWTCSSAGTTLNCSASLPGGNIPCN